MFREKIAIAIFSILIYILLVILIVYSYPDQNKSGITELYFTYIPEHVLSNQLSQFSFEVHNLENKRLRYDYEALVNDVSLKNGTIELAHDDRIQIPVLFKLGGKGEARFQVLLQDKSIHFWADIE